MTRTIALTCCFAVMVPGAAGAKETDEAAALQAAEAWLKLLDAGQYGASWDEEAAAAREPMGKVLSRKVASQQLTHELPGAPDGTYVVLSFDTQFEHKERGHETVTMVLDDGRFRGAGYFIR